MPRVSINATLIALGAFAAVASPRASPTAQEDPRPDGLQLVREWYDPRAFHDYVMRRIYQVVDQQGRPLERAGMLVTEEYGDWFVNTCGIGEILTASARTNDRGRFRDTFFIRAEEACNQQPKCKSGARQTLRVDRWTVAEYDVTWRCDHVDLVPVP